MGKNPHSADAIIEAAGQVGLGLVAEFPDFTVLVFDESRRLVFASGDALAHHGLVLEELIGEDIALRVATSARTQVEEVCERVLGGETVSVEIQLEQGDQARFRVRAQPLKRGQRRLHSSKGAERRRCAGGVALVQDVTSQQIADDRNHALDAVLARAIEQAPTAMHVLSLAPESLGEIVACNGLYARLLGFESSEGIIGRPVVELGPFEDREAHAERIRRWAIGEVGDFEFERRGVRADGSLVWVNVSGSVICGSQDRPAYCVSVVRERDEAASARTLLEGRTSVQTNIIESTLVGVIVTDRDAVISYVNHHFAHAIGYEPQDLVGTRYVELLPDRRRALALEKFERRRRGLPDLSPAPYESDLVHRDGSLVPVLIAGSARTDDDGTFVGSFGMTVDMSELRAREADLELARRSLEAVTDSVSGGVFMLDEAGCVQYMDSMAEELLGVSAQDLHGQVMHWRVNHLAADGSLVMLEDAPLTQAWASGLVVRDDDTVFVRGDGTLVRVSYVAAPYYSDDGLAGCMVVFDAVTAENRTPSQDQVDCEKAGWLRRIRYALDHDRFELVAQPIVDLSTGKTASYELLLRMHENLEDDDDTRLISPGQFLPVAEEFDAIGEIDRWVISRGLEIAARGIPVELNVSAQSVGDREITSYIRRRFKETGTDPQNVVFEITETDFVKDETAARRFVRSMHQLGCKIALDDFGSGYSGFTYLKQLPIDYLKIDMEFVRDLPRNRKSQHVVRAIVDLAASFGLQTVAEGAEDARTVRMLTQLGVDFGQGYHLGRPAALRLDQAARAEGIPASNQELGSHVDEQGAAVELSQTLLEHAEAKLAEAQMNVEVAQRALEAELDGGRASARQHGSPLDQRQAQLEQATAERDHHHAELVRLRRAAS
ncbi:MAG TPA: EAL domain-containing protein [Solirubrobacteraceae bacterium]|jgi:PAS domain S-box-containing protein|nr:EAL domain-containing protein [Solirubrobacteraceae bacterium]